MKRLFSLLSVVALCIPFLFPHAALADCGVKELVVSKTLTSPAPYVCTDEKETCQGNTIQYSCCLCESEKTGNAVDASGQAIGAISFMGDGYTHDTCEQRCKDYGVLEDYHIYPRAGAGTLPAGAPGGPKTSNEVQAIAQYCFTKADCSSQDYGGTPDAFRPGYGCSAGKGRCVAPEPVLTLSNPIGGITTVAGYRGFVGTVFNYAIGIAAIAAAVMFVWGGMRYIFGSAFQDIKRAKEIMVDAAVGLVLVLGAMAILRTVNPDTLNLNKLEVFLINKEEVTGQQFCSAVTATSGKPVFADAGQSPAFTPISDIKDADYHIKQDKTQCGYEYYVKGFGENRCKGQACNEGEACIACGKDGACPNNRTTGFGCVQATLAGTITNDGDRPALTVNLLALCFDMPSYYARSGGDLNIKLTQAASDALGAGFNFDYLQLNQYYPQNSFVDLGPARLSDASKVLQSYAYILTQKDIDKANEGCGGTGVEAYVLGVRYKNSGDIDLAHGGTGAVGSTIANEVLSDNLYTILGKDSCGSGSPFLGYVRENVDSGSDEGDVTFQMSLAAACAIGRLNPYADKANANMDDVQNHLQVRKAIDAHGWSLSELQRKKDGKDQTVKCDIKLNKTNAPAVLSKLPNTAPGTLDIPGAPGMDKSMPIVYQKGSALGFFSCYGP